MTNDTPQHGTVTYVVAAEPGNRFTGDALMHLHGFHHVDGDYPLKSCGSNERYRSMTETMLEASICYAPRGEDGPEELWTPYFTEIAHLALKAVQENPTKNVVLTHATARQAYREKVVNTLMEDGGLDRDSINIVELTIDPDVRLKGLYYRSKRQAEGAGMTLGDTMRSSGWEGEGEVTLDDWMDFGKKIFESGDDKELFESIPEGFGKIVDVSSRDIGHIEAVEKALGLSPNDRVRTVGSYEELREEIKKFDAQRDVDSVSSGSRDILVPMFEKVFAKKNVVADHSKNAESSNKNEEDAMIEAADVDDEEKERMKKRRSSMVSAELLMEELGGRGSSSSDGARKSAATMKARRSSLIMTGKI